MENSEEKKFKIGQQLLGVEDVRGQYKKGSDIWKYEIPTPFLKREIEKIISQKIGVPLENFDKQTYALTKACTYVDNVCIETPDWWESAEECRDEELIFAIFYSFMDFENKFRGSLKRNKFKRNSQNPSP